ncbi:MAG: RNA polymerase subunit sigma, partial [Ruminococcus sp.]|nr:RNA polymerase subunit sigma [Ruminococcus sp.]
VILFYVENYSIKEIKSILHIPEGTVKSRLNKGRSLLKEALG